MVDPLLAYFGESSSFGNFCRNPAKTIKVYHPQTLRPFTPGSYCKCRILAFSMALYGRLSAKLIIRHVKDNSEIIYLDPCNKTLERSNRQSESSDNADVTRLFLAPGFGMMNGNNIRRHEVASLEAGMKMSGTATRIKIVYGYVCNRLALGNTAYSVSKPQDFA